MPGWPRGSGQCTGTLRAVMAPRGFTWLRTEGRLHSRKRVARILRDQGRQGQLAKW